MLDLGLSPLVRVKSVLKNPTKIDLPLIIT